MVASASARKPNARQHDVAGSARPKPPRSHHPGPGPRSAYQSSLGERFVLRFFPTFAGARIRLTAVTPERIAPSMVPGSRVSVQSPASIRFSISVAAPGRRSSCATLATIVARRSLITLNGGTSVRCSPFRFNAFATLRQMLNARSSAERSINLFAALTVIEI